MILIGALFRANRFRANPTNLYGADEYIEEQIPEKEFRQIIRKLFPQVGETSETPIEPREYDEARRLARLILSDIIIYHVDKVEQGIRDDNFFEILRDEIDEGRQYYDSRVPHARPPRHRDLHRDPAAVRADEARRARETEDGNAMSSQLAALSSQEPRAGEPASCQLRAEQ